MYNEIAQSLVQVLPENWEDVMLYTHVREYGYEIFFYVKVDDKYIGCFNMEKRYGISMDEIMDCFDEIYDILYPDYQKKGWFSASVRLSNDGKMLMYYDYDDHTEDEDEYHVEWKKKYLSA